MIKSLRVKVKDAAQLLGVSVLDIRSGLETGFYPFGVARKVCSGPVKWGRGQRNFKYIIFAPQLADFLKITEQDLLERIGYE